MMSRDELAIQSEETLEKIAQTEDAIKIMLKRKEELIKKKQFMLQATFKNENGQPDPSQTKGKKSINNAIQDHPDLKNLIKVIKKIYRTIFYNEHPLATKQDQTIQRSTIQAENNEENKED